MRSLIRIVHNNSNSNVTDEMRDFEKFKIHLLNNNLCGVKKHLKPDFLECPINESGNRPLHHACKIGNIDLGRLLIENGCDIECQSLENRKPMHYACENGHYETVKMLIENQANIECETLAEKLRPIHYACSSGHLTVVKLLIDNNCDIEAKTVSKHLTPIHLSCWYGHQNVVKLLIKKNCSMTCETSSRKWQPIHFASWYGNRNIMKLFIKHRMNIEAETLPKNYRPIHFVCQNGYIDILLLLIKNDCNIECKTLDNDTPRDIALKFEHYHCVQLFDEIGLKREKILASVRNNNETEFIRLCQMDKISMLEYKNLEVLETALAGNSTQIIKCIINRAVSDKQINQLREAIENGYFQNRKILSMLEETFLYRCIWNHHAEGFHVFCTASTVNRPRQFIPSSFVETAAEFGCNSFINEILKKSIYDSKTWQSAKDIAREKDHKYILSSISKRESLLKARERAGISILHTAVCDYDTDMIMYILDNRLVDMNVNNEIFGTAMSFSFLLCEEDCVHILKRYGITLNTKNKFSQTPLHEAITSGMIDSCDYLIEKVDKIDEIGFGGLTALHCAVIQKCPSLCSDLLKRGSNFCQHIKISMTSLLYNSVPQSVSPLLPYTSKENAVTLCLKMNRTIYPCFLEVLDRETANMTDDDGNSLLHLAVKLVQPDLCQDLINAGAVVDQLNNAGNTPLLELMCSLSDTILDQNIDSVTTTTKVLVEFGSDICKVTGSGMTCFQCLSRVQNEKLVTKFLVNSSILENLTFAEFLFAINKGWLSLAYTYLNIIPVEVMTPRITSEVICSTLNHGASKLMKLLFERADIEVQQSVIDDILLKSASNDDEEMFNFFIVQPIHHPKVFDNGQTLLTTLIDSNEKYTLKILSSENSEVYVNVKNQFQQTPLHVAIISGTIDIIEHLIFESNSLDCEDNGGATPLVLLFRKISGNHEAFMEQRLLRAIKSIILRGGLIYQSSSVGHIAIEACTNKSIRQEIEIFFVKERTKLISPAVESAILWEKKICTICIDHELNCAFQCGHTFCWHCAEKFECCPICKTSPTCPRRIYLN